jgi:MYXO-CTERM domain-containing protein
MDGSRKALALALLVAGSSTWAAPFTAIRIGDIDGFGFTTDVPVLRAASGAAVDTDGDTRIELGEFLPDIPAPVAPGGLPALGSPGDGFVQVTAAFGGPFLGFDDFDNRSAADAASTNLGGGGYVDTGTTGSQFTDLSLSASFGLARVYRSPGAFTFPGSPLPFPFPDPAGVGLPNEPSFSFRFDVATTDIDPLQQVFFNMLIGDYDVEPAEVQLVLNDGNGGPGTIVTLPLTLQDGEEDGLVQGAFATLAFSDVFSADPMGGKWNGFLDVRVLAPGEPYLAFDFVELSTRPIINAPAPGALALLALGGLLAHRLRRRHARR